MNPTFANPIAALVPTGMLLLGSAVQFSTERYSRTFPVGRCSGSRGGHHCSLMRGARLASLDALGLAHSDGDYIDLVAAIGGLSLFPIGYLFGALTR